jgi:uncharacterized protein YndB with AHSA1/START domain
MYTVVAQRQIQAPIETVWENLTRPELLAMWFADTERFAPGEPVRMEFGDGDFLAGRVTEWEPGIVLGLRWKSVGCGPEHEVRYSMLRRKGGTELTVQDRGAITVELAECLRVGWSEFLMRFEKSLLKKVSTRFNWRKALNVTVEVKPGAREALLAALGDPGWYANALAGARAQIQEPREEDVVAAAVSHDAWGDAETRARVRLRDIRGVDYAFASHEGWGELPGHLAEGERRRFVGVWIRALSEFSAG